MKIGDRIKVNRERLGMTQDDIARYLGVKPQTVYKYEKGIISNVPLDTIVRLAKLFEISPGELAGWDKKEKPTATDGDELAKALQMIESDPTRKKLFEYIMTLDADELKRINRILDAALDR